MNEKRKIELLAPAKNKMVAIEALLHGADAVYMGAAKFGARAVAGNSVHDIGEVCGFAHQFGAKVYVTVNTIVFDNEIADVQALIWKLYEIGVDAIIVQDLGILEMKLPPIALHASTQCDIRTPEKALFLQSLGFTQLVLARELSIPEIEDISSRVNVPLEGFVHGALCVCYSGRCQASYAFCGRSANRGECAQICRFKFDLTDKDGKVLIKGKHLLSLKDNNQSHNLGPLIDAGVSSFKIEGRLKDASYVKNVVAYYRKKLDQIISKDSSLERSSCGTSTISFTPELDRSFNRGFTDYFVNNRHLSNGIKMANLDTPKSVGEPLGVIKRINGKDITIETSKLLKNGDGIGTFDKEGNFTGARVNVAMGNKIVLNQTVSAQRGQAIYRTFNKDFDDVLSKPTAVRKIGVDFILRTAGDKALVLDATDERGNRVSRCVDCEFQKAKSPQQGQQTEILSKMGNTIYSMKSAIVLNDTFIPASLLATLRRDTLDLLDRAQRISFKFPVKGKRSSKPQFPYQEATYADNVCNNLARDLYATCGVKKVEPAMEKWGKGHDYVGREVMNTRYCLRRELGCCLKNKNAAGKMPRQLFMKSGRLVLEVHCDCTKCEMHLILAQK